MLSSEQEIFSTNSGNNSLIFLIGSMGCGKTFWGKHIAKKKQIDFIDLDTAIEQSVGMSIADIFEIKGETFFREKETELLIGIISTSTKAIIATGGGTPCFNNNIALMNQNGISIWLDDNVDKMYQRVKCVKETRPLLKNIPDQNLLSYIKDLVNTRTPFYSQCKYRLIGDEISESALIQIVNQYV